MVKKVIIEEDSDQDLSDGSDMPVAITKLAAAEQFKKQ